MQILRVTALCDNEDASIIPIITNFFNRFYSAVPVERVVEGNHYMRIAFCIKDLPQDTEQLEIIVGGRRGEE